MRMSAICPSIMFIALFVTVFQAGQLCAEPIVIDFEQFEGMDCTYANPGETPVPESCQLFDQLLASYGLIFTSGSPFVAVLDYWRCVPSGRRFIEGSTPDGLWTCSSDYPVTITFRKPGDGSIPAVTDFVSVHADLCGDGNPITLKAYDVEGNLVASCTRPDSGAILEVSTPGKIIHQVKFFGHPYLHDGVAIDDLTFNAPVPVNRPPIADAGADIAIKSADQSLTTIQGMASDPDGDALQYRWLEGVVELVTWAGVVDGMAPFNLATIPALAVGHHAFTLEVSDGTDMVPDMMTLTILNTPPVGVLNPTSLTVELGSEFTIKAMAADFDGDMLAYQWVKGSEVLGLGTIDAPDDGSPIAIADLVVGANDPRFGLGSHTVDLVLDDPVNGPVTTTATVAVEDSTLPTLSPVSSESILWPPNHELRPITIQGNASDNGGAVTLTASVQSNEPQEDGGDGSTDRDWTTPIIDNLAGIIQVSLRAERSGSGSGRVYTITITATDQSGNVSVATVEVRVPHDRKTK